MNHIKQSAKLIFWVLLWLIVVDVAIGQLFQYPEKQTHKPSRLVSYFDHGRSIEGKIRRMVTEHDDTSHPLTKPGWFVSRNKALAEKEGSETERIRVFIYGMSFSQRLGSAIAKLDDQLDVRSFGGPAAPLNHSFSYYESHRPHRAGDLIILPILASSLPRMNGLTHMTANFEGPSPHFYPRYYLDHGVLTSASLPVHSLPELRQVLRQPAQWNALRKMLSQHDAYFDSFVFDRSWSDYSVILRMLRRAWGQRQFGHTKEIFHNNEGFKNSQGMLNIAHGILKRFALDSNFDNTIPVVVLFNNKGYSDHLYTALTGVLDEQNIASYSSHEQFPAENLSNFEMDGHFKSDVDEAMAREILVIIRGLTKRQQQNKTPTASSVSDSRR